MAEPFLYLVGRNGKVAFQTRLGELDFHADDLERAIREILAKREANVRLRVEPSLVFRRWIPPCRLPALFGVSSRRPSRRPYVTAIELHQGRRRPRRRFPNAVPTWKQVPGNA